MVVSSQPALAGGGSVSHDWRKPLAAEKARLYLHSLRTLETAYGMFSVNLDEAFGMRRYGLTSKALQLLRVAPALCNRLASPLRSLLIAMLEHAKHFGTAPNILPLDPDNFQHSRSQRAARLSDLFGKILLTRKSQFLHKMSSLSDLVNDLDSSFGNAMDQLPDELSIHLDCDWDLLDSVHYDLNTCLRETEVLLKCFLHALPESQLADFETSLHRSIPAPARVRHLAHRRMALLKGQ
jgi:hypothetical protein